MLAMSARVRLIAEMGSQVKTSLIDESFCDPTAMKTVVKISIHLVSEFYIYSTVKATILFFVPYGSASNILERRTLIAFHRSSIRHLSSRAILSLTETQVPLTVTGIESQIDRNNDDELNELHRMRQKGDLV